MKNLLLKKEAAKSQAFIDDIITQFISEVEALEGKVESLKKENERLKAELYSAEDETRL